MNVLYLQEIIKKQVKEQVDKLNQNKHLLSETVRMMIEIIFIWYASFCFSN